MYGRGKNFLNKLSDCQKQSSKNCNSSVLQNLAALSHFPKLPYVFDCIMSAHLREERTTKLLLMYDRGKKYRRQVQQLPKQRSEKL